MNPDTARRLKLMDAANRMLANGQSLVEQQLEAAVGAPPAKVKALREAKTAAEKHFVMQS